MAVDHLRTTRVLCGTLALGIFSVFSAFGDEQVTDTQVPRLRVAAKRFGILPENVLKGNTAKLTRKATVAGPLKVTVTLLDDGRTRLCVISLDWVKIPRNVTQLLRRNLGAVLSIPAEQVIFFTSHNHSDVSLVTAESGGFEWGMPPYEGPEAKLNDIGQELLNKLMATVHTLSEELQPVTVWWAVGNEGRITYNRKGRWADGSTFLMREEDRLLQGADYRGDIDTQAPVVVFKNLRGEPVAAWVQFTGHPVTSFHPEYPVVHGDYPSVACEVLGQHLAQKQAGGEDVPVGFLQGCAGDVNSKEMFRGGVKRAVEFGEILGQSYIDTLPQLKLSTRDGLDFSGIIAELPLAELPDEKTLARELDEIDDFIRRARAGDENTISCVGLNFPHDLSPAYRAGLVERIRYWTAWALEQQRAGTSAQLPPFMPIDMWIFRVGDVGVVGMPCEPFQGIGREIRAESPLPLVIPCGYTNYTIGYIPDGANVGDTEYMSSFHRYTASPDKSIRPRPPYARPGGSVMAHEAIRVFGEMVKKENR